MRSSFWRHFLEMIGVMVVSMVVFGAAVSGVLNIAMHAMGIAAVFVVVLVPVVHDWLVRRI